MNKNPVVERSNPADNSQITRTLVSKSLDGSAFLLCCPQFTSLSGAASNPYIQPSLANILGSLPQHSPHISQLHRINFQGLLAGAVSLPHICWTLTALWNWEGITHDALHILSVIPLKIVLWCCKVLLLALDKACLTWTTVTTHRRWWKHFLMQLFPWTGNPLALFFHIFGALADWSIAQGSYSFFFSIGLGCSLKLPGALFLFIVHIFISVCPTCCSFFHYGPT